MDQVLGSRSHALRHFNESKTPDPLKLFKASSAGTHSVPDSIQVILQISLEIFERLLIYSSGTSFGLHFQVCLPYQSLGNLEWFCFVRRLLPPRRLAVRSSLSNQAPSLHRHYSGFLATTSLSVPVQRIDTISLAGSLLVPFSYHRYDRFPQFNMRARIKLTPPLCRVPPGQ